MTLGDAFNRRKKLAADLQSWTGRLSVAGAERRTYRTSVLEGDNAYRPDPGTEKASTRQYTVQECRDKIAEILEEDEQLALRISRTNQRARAEIVDLSGQTRVLSIPELLVLKDDAIPKLEQAARAVPLRADDVTCNRFLAYPPTTHSAGVFVVTGTVHHVFCHKHRVSGNTKLRATTRPGQGRPRPHGA
jgi:hypothetical protein